MDIDKSIDHFKISANIKNIIFDLDGTLYPLKTLKANLFFAAMKSPKRANLFRKARELVRSINWDDEQWTSRSKFLSRQAASVNVSVQYFDKYYSDMAKRFIKLKPFAGVKDTLYHLKRSGYRLFVYSDFPIENKLKEMRIEEYFDAAICSETTGFLKPDPRGFDFIKKMTGVENNDTLFVGDDDRKDGGFARNCSLAFAKVGETWIWREEKDS